VLDPDESHYVARVRRGRPGSALELLVPEAGASFDAIILDPHPERVVVAVGEACRLPSPRRDVLLLLGLPDAAAALSALNHACQIGATRVVFTLCAHAHHRAPSPERIDRTLRASCRQSGRPRPPEIRGPLPFDQALAAGRDLARFLARPGGTAAVTLAPGEGACLLVGPEGGLSIDEERHADELGFRAVDLGPWTLRCPEAALAGLARLIQA
jgi:16S rRNA (uracil1498-N3)-methyltransferase